MLEGDDYWTDPYKLQKQVDFLEANPDFAICFHSVNVNFQNSDSDSYISNEDQKGISTIQDLCTRNFIHTPSCVFRNGLIKQLPKWHTECPIGDWPLHMLNAQHGKIKFLNEAMAVYRVHGGGVWESKNAIYRIIKTVETYEKMLGYFDREIDMKLREVYTIKTKDIAFYFLSRDDKKTARKYFIKLFRYGLQEIFSKRDAIYWIIKTTLGTNAISNQS
jgi:Txe/YoeB family toxin of Txe-Axe toxin-antitoxin module